MATEIEIIPPQPVVIELQAVGIQGPPGSGGGSAMIGAPTFIQTAAPTGQTGPYAWWDTSGGNLTLWIEDAV